MKFIILFLAFSVDYLAFGDLQRSWFEDQIEKTIGQPYTQGYQSLQTGVVNELVSVDISSLDDNSVTALTNRLFCATKSAYDSFQRSVSASESIQWEVNTRISESLVQAGSYERDIYDKDTELAQTNQGLSEALDQLALAEKAVIEKEEAVRIADQQVQQAQEDLEQARLCRGKRNWFNRITRPITRPIEDAVKNVIVRPVCSLINEGGISNAKDRRTYARQQLGSAQNQEQHYRTVVAEIQQRESNLSNQIVQLRSLLASTQSSLKMLQNELATTINIDKELKQVIMKLGEVFSGASVLQETVIHLIDFELLTNPLNAIYTAIHQLTSFGSATIISEEQIQKTKNALSEINLRLPNMPLVLNTNLLC